ncbi:hypothetical protein RASY3_05815 [Ruminococcus albus SY3]|uniref:CBM2 domain-containing protein n=1 Tax=Ruminococcus albus SY3 TaxID=1341156 RepID=A0A011V3S3_RUMAL|nr:hypothetical protein [Ruminococcus albus]EXM40107.1 hypothetical protein RASY3_05815 [Ruminococcus albus SY3]
MTKIKKIISGITALAITCGLSLPASAVLNKGDSRAYRGTGYLAKYEVLSVKDGYTTVQITLKNTSKKTINNWAVGFEHEGRILSLKNGRIFDTNYLYNSGYAYGYNVIRDSGTNGKVAPNECVSFSFTMTDENGYNELPERLKVYSDVDKSNTVDGLNKAASECYKAVNEIFWAYECEGLSLEDCFKNGEFTKANSKDGMKTGFNYKYTAKGDSEINIAASQFARGNISVYVGRTTTNGEEHAFVQIKDNKTGKIGQYPHPAQGTVTWGTFDLNAPIYTNYSVDDVNRAAKWAYNAVAEYIADLETVGEDFMGSFENGGFLYAHSNEGLKIDFSGSLAEGDQAINEEMKLYYDGIIVYAGKKTSSDGEFEFFVQAKDPETGKIGQYPNPTQGEATWGTFDENTPSGAKPLSDKELDEEAETAYYAAAEYFTDMYYDHGWNVQEVFDNGGYSQAHTKDGLKIGTATDNDGDKYIIEELLCNGYGGNISVYVGEIESENHDEYFVQIKDNTTGKIGQYPTPDHRDLEWGTYSKAPAKMTHDQRTLNGDAKTAYNAVAEYLANLETEGYDVWECYKNGCFAKASTKEGLKIGQETSLTDGDKFINNELRCNGRYYEGLTVYVGMKKISNSKYGDIDFFVQVKDATGRVGQYPDPTRDSATWGTLHAKEPNQSEKVTVSLYDHPGSATKIDSIQLKAGSSIPESTIASWNELGESKTTGYKPYGSDRLMRTVFVSIQSATGERIEEYIDKPILEDLDFFICTVLDEREKGF